MDPWQLAAVPLGLLCALGCALLLLRPPSNSSPPSPPQHQLSRLGQDLVRAGWGTIDFRAAVAMWLLMSAIVGALVVVMIPIPALGLIAGVALASAGRQVILSRISRRERRLRQSWPGVVDHLRSAVRSGASVSEAMVVAGSKAPGEVARACDDFGQQLEQGVRVDTALANLKDQLANPIADRIIESLRMAHEVGGHALPGVLESLQSSVRADISVREDALARQSWIRAASRLGAAAPWIVMVVLSGRPETIEAYSSPAGAAILVAGALLTVFAYRMMSRLGRLPDDERWFAG